MAKFLFLLTTFCLLTSIAYAENSEFTVYKSANELFVYSYNYTKSFYYSPDGKNLYEMKKTGLIRSYDERRVSFCDPHGLLTGKLEIKISKGALRFQNKIFKRIQSLTIIPMQNVRLSEYFFNLQNGCLLYVSRDKYRFSYQSLKLFLENSKKEMEEIHIDDVFCFGGLYIVANKDTLFVPNGNSKKATWKGKNLKELDVNEYNIAEKTENFRTKLKITKKQN